MILFTNKRSFHISITAIILAISLFLSDPTLAEENKTISIQPFAIHASADLGYLQNGVKAMLSSRLAANGGATIIENGADYLVTGSITSLGKSISLDAKVTSTTGTEESFYSSASRQNDIITAITDLSWQISEKMLNRKRPALHVVTVPVSNPTVAGAQNESSISTQTPHPEKSFITSHSSNSTSPLIGSKVKEAGGFTKLPNFKMYIKGMDIGDIDGDGLADVVVVGNNELIVYKNNKGIYGKMSSSPLSSRYLPHGVSVADLNGNNKAEIYVSAADNHAPRSFGLEWNGNHFTEIFSQAPWYIRTLDIPGYGPALIGQRSSTTAVLRSGIFRLNHRNNKVQIEEKLSVPDHVNLFDFIYADINGNGTHELVIINQDDQLQVLQPDGNLTWQSSDHYGGMTRFIGGEDDSQRTSSDYEISDAIGMEEKERVYVPSRIIATDLNDDKITDILVKKNLSTASRLLKNTRNYPSDEMYGLTWDGIGLAELWSSKKINGYVVDYQILPATEGNPTTLFVAVVLKSGWLGSFAKPESTVLMYTLN